VAGQEPEHAYGCPKRKPKTPASTHAVIDLLKRIVKASGTDENVLTKSPYDQLVVIADTLEKSKVSISDIIILREQFVRLGKDLGGVTGISDTNNLREMMSLIRDTVIHLRLPEAKETLFQTINELEPKNALTAGNPLLRLAISVRELVRERTKSQDELIEQAKSLAGKYVLLEEQQEAMKLELAALKVLYAEKTFALSTAEEVIYLVRTDIEDCDECLDCLDSATKTLLLEDR
jgi:hypothetical protein